MASKSRLRKSRGNRPPEPQFVKTAHAASATHKPWHIAALCLILAIVTVVSFQGVRNNAFLPYDDYDYVLENPIVQQGLTIESIEWAFSTYHAANWHPLTWISHILDWDLYGNDPSGHHLTNVYLHAANAVLLFLFLVYITGYLGRSAIVAFLFALHPAHVESVAWVAERKDVLCAFFYLATLLAYAWYVRQPSWKRFAWIVLGFACALMSKPMAVTLPFTLLLLDYWPLRRITFTPKIRAQGLSSLWKLCVEKWLLFLMAAISSVITMHAQRAGGVVIALQSQSLPIWARAGNAAISYCRYLQITFWPHPLIAYYYYDLNNVTVSAVLLSILLLLLISAVCWRFRKQHPYCLAGWLWFLVTLLPVIGIVQVGGQAMAERYTYIPLIGIFIAVVWLAGDAVFKFPRLKIAAQLFAVAVLLACAFETVAQVKFWKDMQTLFSHVVEVDPRGEIPNLYLGTAYMRQGKLDEAEKEYRRVLAVLPGSYDVHNDLGLLLGRRGQFTEALKEFRLAVAIQPDGAFAHSNLAWALTQTRQYPQAVEEFTQALRFDPNNASTHNNLGVALLQLGDFEKAAEQFNDAIQINPSYADPRRNLVLAQAGMKSKNVDRVTK
jgi:Tfp pilus assembly protein PilF